MLTADIKKLITDHNAGMVASVDDDGMPAVSPKATFVILSDSAIAFGNIRSPGTVANLRKRPATEVCFIDVLARKAARITGTAKVIRKADADEALIAAFESAWRTYLPNMSAFVVIEVTAAELITSPAYDLGFTEEELRKTNLERLNSL